MGYDIIVIFGSPYIDLSGTILEQRYKKILLKAYNAVSYTHLGGKSLHLADKLKGTGRVEARDLTEYKVDLIRENIERSGLENIYARRKDALVFDPADKDAADLVLADVPCSGYGVIGHKTDIKYKMTPAKEADLVLLQRRILHNAAQCVQPGGTLIYSTCTINPRENEENVRWFLEHYPFEAESLNPYLRCV